MDFDKLKYYLLRSPVEKIYDKEKQASLEERREKNIDFLFQLYKVYEKKDLPKSKKDEILEAINQVEDHLLKQRMWAVFADTDKMYKMQREDDEKIESLLQKIESIDENISDSKSSSDFKVDSGENIESLTQAFRNLRIFIISRSDISNFEEVKLTNSFINDIDLAIENLERHNLNLEKALGKTALLELLEGLDIIINPKNKYFKGVKREFNSKEYRSHLEKKYSILFDSGS